MICEYCKKEKGDDIHTPVQKKRVCHSGLATITVVSHCAIKCEKCRKWYESKDGKHECKGE